MAAPLVPGHSVSRSIGTTRLGSLLRILCLSVLGGLVPQESLRGQEMDLPVATQWTILDRVLAFDRAFAARTVDGIVVAVLYQDGYRPSLLAANELAGSARDSQGNVLVGARVQVVRFEASTVTDLAERLRESNVDLLYVAPLRAFDLQEVARAAAASNTPTFTGVREYLDAGLAFGVGQRGGRPEILVNLSGARAQGMDLSAQLLRLATVIGPKGKPGGSSEPPAQGLHRFAPIHSSSLRGPARMSAGESCDDPRDRWQALAPQQFIEAPSSLARIVSNRSN